MKAAKGAAEPPSSAGAGADAATAATQKKKPANPPPNPAGLNDAARQVLNILPFQADPLPLPVLETSSQA
jgi:hypothetical protein